MLVCDGLQWPHQNGEKWLRQAFECRAGGWSAHKRSQREEAVRGSGERSSDRSRGGATSARSSGADEPRSRQMLKVTDDTFRAAVLEEPRPVVAIFHKPGCPACVDVKAEMALLERSYADQIVVATIDTAAERESARAYVDNGVPLVVVFGDGVEHWRRRGGSVTARSVGSWVDDLLAEEAA